MVASLVPSEAAWSGELVLDFVGHIEISLVIAHCQRLSLGIDKERMETFL
jgi:hypothetical protein